MTTPLAATPAQFEFLERRLQALVGEADAAAVRDLRDRLEWVEVGSGETLMQQGEPGDAVYLAISGRLRAYVRDEDGTDRAVRDMGRGQVIGEMSLYTDEPRSATVVAVRDSVLVRLSKSQFDDLLARHGRLGIVLARQVIERLREAAPPGPAKPVTMSLLPISAGVDAAGFAAKLAEHLARIGRVTVVDADSLDRALAEPGLAQRDAGDAEANRRIGLYLDQVEAEHDQVLLVADAAPTEWTRRCTRRSDEILLLADASRPAAVHETERLLLSPRGRAEASEVLVLLHREDVRRPSGTRQWRARRPVNDHVHVRPALDRDMARLARLQSRTAVGLVFAGGGARGLAHLGLYRALLERGYEIDCVGGTSIGAVMAALVASDRPIDEVTSVARRSFAVNPTGDFNLVPLLSLISGRRLRRVIRTAVEDLFGGQPDIEDLWKSYYCVASNYSQAREQVLRQGELMSSVIASVAIPGALPPVARDGDLLCDGGTFNNFPVDVMRGLRGVGQVIGVDLAPGRARPVEHTEMPGTWALLRDRLRPRHRRHYRLPSLISYLMNVTILYGSSRQRRARELTDLYFNPPLHRVGLLQWNRFDDIVRQGHEHGVEVLDRLGPGSPAGTAGAAG